ncbi:MAG: helix-turn-helix domain-containing protein, partial [Lacrimispora sp.]
AAMRQGEHLFPEDNLIFYRDIRAINILSEQQYNFSEIAFLDRSVTSFDACRTLESFLENGSIKRAAAQSFIHDNTMRYRIQKIEQLLNVDLTRPLTRINLLLKLKLWYLSEKDGKNVRGYESVAQWDV